MKDLVSTVLTGVKTTLEGGNKLLGDAAGAHMGALAGYVTGLVTWPLFCPQTKLPWPCRAGHTF
jgi:hypothetical protein